MVAEVVDQEFREFRGQTTYLSNYYGNTLAYAYNAAGQVTSMNDYGSNATTYTYTDTGQLSTVTAPNTGNKWDFDYNAIGQTTKYTHPNGLDSVFSYDNGNRMTKIELKDSTTVVESFAYGLADAGNRNWGLALYYSLAINETFGD